MAMSDCRQCWETPCCCGHEFNDQVKKMDYQALIKMKHLIENRLKDLNIDGSRNLKPSNSKEL